MFKIKGLVAGALIALLLVSSPALSAQADQSELAAQSDSTGANDILGRYTTDGGKTWIAVREVKGVVERIPAGTSKEEFMKSLRMTAEAESKIIHAVPPVPVIIDGARYEPEQVNLFDGRQLGFTVGKDGQLTWSIK